MLIMQESLLVSIYCHSSLLSLPNIHTEGSDVGCYPLTLSCCFKLYMWYIRQILDLCMLNYQQEGISKASISINQCSYGMMVTIPYYITYASWDLQQEAWNDNACMEI